MSTAAKVMLGKKVKVFSMGSYGGADGILLAGTEKIKISISTLFLFLPLYTPKFLIFYPKLPRH